MRARSLLIKTALVLATLLSPVAAADETVQSIIDQATLAEYQTYLRVLTGADPMRLHARISSEPCQHLPRWQEAARRFEQTDRGAECEEPNEHSCQIFV